MSLAIDFTGLASGAAGWLAMINDGSHGVLDILMAFTIGGGALFALYRYLQQSQN